jgi:phospholipase C
MYKHSIVLVLALCLGIISCQKSKQDSFEQNIKKINHVVVIYMENHSFDNLYGQFKGADGLSNASKKQIIQVNKKGVPYEMLPPVPRSSAIPSNLPNHYFNIDQYIPSDKITPSPTHRYYQQIMQIDGDKMDKFVAYDSKKGLAMGYYKTSLLPLDSLAKEYTLCDHFFQSGFGGSYFNHVFLIAAAPAVWKDAPSDMVAKLDSTGKMIKDGAITPDGYAVNTVFPENPPHPTDVDTSDLLPPQTIPTIGDRLNSKNISWAWYSQGWDAAVDSAKAGHGESSLFAYNHEPFIYFANYAPGSEGRKHLKDEKDYLKAAKEGILPSVSFVKPGRGFDEHPGSAAVLRSEKHAVKLINAALNGPDSSNTLIILTYDENGGFWDHVPPPKIDRWGPGTRIPAIMIGPFVKKGYVDHTQYETVSILSFIEHRWDLKPLTDRDKNANPLRNIFAF